MKKLAPSPFVALLPLLLMGAKCPEVPPCGHDPHDPYDLCGPSKGGPTGAGGASGGVHDGGVHDGGAGGAGGKDAGSGTDAGSPAACVPASPTDVWVTEAVNVSPPAQSNVGSISSLNPNDAWLATGVDVEHWDGTSWSPVPSVTPGSILAVSHNDVWVANETIQEWNGSSWIDHTPIPETDQPSYTIWGRNSTDLWAIDQTVPARVLNWDGSSWSDRQPIGVDGVKGLWAAAANDVWAMATQSTSTGGPDLEVLIHWNGTTWQVVFQIPAGTDGLGPPFLYAIWGSSAHDIWVFAQNSASMTQLWHFDGSTWSNPGTLPVVYFDLWGSCSNNYWAVNGNHYAHFDGASWTTGTLTETGTILGAVGGSGPDDVWIGGTNSQNNAVAFHHLPGDPGPACGNVRLDPGEQCDPPDGVFCGPDCQRLDVCGDGFIELGEDCDPPNGDTCGASCHFIPTCGNGVLDPGEQCDPPGNVGNLGGLLACDANCQRPTCGNGVLDPGETCDPPLEIPDGRLWCDLTCHRPTCGNGIIDPGETCDPPKRWQPGTGSPLYCGDSCTFEDACTDCHNLCDPMPIPFSLCEARFCDQGPFSPCG